MTTTAVPPIAVESARQNTLDLLEECTYARFAELGPRESVDLVRRYALNVMDALTPDEPEAVEDEPAPALCRECAEGKHQNCDTTAWSDEADAPTACSCVHPDVKVITDFTLQSVSIRPGPNAFGYTAQVVSEPPQPAPGRGLVGYREPYVGTGSDGARRSAEIDRTEAETVHAGSARWYELMGSAAKWEVQAGWLEGQGQ
jgi:hypothetical protein